MRTRKLWLALCATLLCVALLYATFAVSAEELIDVELDLETNDTEPTMNDIVLELDPGINASLEEIPAIDIDVTSLGLCDDLVQVGSGNSDVNAVILSNDEPTESEIEPVLLAVTYSGPALTKEYDLTRNVFKKTASGGYAYAVTVPNASDFSLEPIAGNAWVEGHTDVQINIASIKAVEQFAQADVGSYELKFTFGLKGNDAQYYAAQSVTIPATITPRLVEVTPRAGVSKVYGTKDPVYPEGSRLSKDETSPLHQDISGVPGYGVPVNMKDGSLQLDVTNQEYLLAEAKLKGTKFFPNDGWLSREAGENVGKYKITIGKMNFGKNFKITLKDEVFTITAKNLADANITVDSIAPQKYTGKAVELDDKSLVVHYGDLTLKKGTDYTVTYSDNIEIGTAKVKLIGKGNYTGTRESIFTIDTPAFDIKGTSLTKVKGGKRQISVKWKERKHITGYQIAYSLTEDFAIWEDQIVRDPKKTGITIKGLRSKKTYYVRIRTYKRLNGKRHYSNWSKAKKVRTK